MTPEHAAAMRKRGLTYGPRVQSPRVRQTYPCVNAPECRLPTDVPNQQCWRCALQKEKERKREQKRGDARKRSGQKKAARPERPAPAVAAHPICSSCEGPAKRLLKGMCNACYLREWRKANGVKNGRRTLGGAIRTP